MSSIQRNLNGNVPVHHLSEDQRMIDAELLAQHGRSSRTLVKEGPLRLTLMALAANGNLPKHSAQGPVSIHVTEGSVVFTAEGSDYSLTTGDVLVFGAGVEHSAVSVAGTVFLLTVVHVENSDRVSAPSGSD